MRPRAFVLSVFLLSFAADMSAQEIALEGTLSDSIVITATRYPEASRKTGRRLSVWTAHDIQRLPVTSFDELLRTVAGVDVQSRGGFGIQSDLSIRGSGFNGVLVLLDGARINDPMTGHFLSDMPIPVSEIARVEVLRGPAGTLYGPDALGGVVQIFTYTGLADPSEPARRLQGTLEAGRHDLYDIDVAAAGTFHNILLSGATAWQGTDGEAILGDDVRTDFSRRVHTASTAAKIGRSVVRARAGWDARDFGAYHFYTPFPSDTAREATATYWLQARMSAPGWDVQASAKQHDDRYVYNPSTPANTHTSRMANVSATRTWRRAENFSITAGLDAGLRGIDSNNLGRHQDVSAGVLGTAGWRSGRFSVHGGGRVDYDPAYGAQWTPQLYAVYSAGRLDARAGLGRAVRAPNYIERYFNTTLAQPRGRSLGNPNLDPERAWSLEAGVTTRPAQGVEFHVTAFRRVTRDLIDYAKLAERDTVFLARNLHRVRALGLESELTARRSLGKTDLHFTTGYVFLDADLGEVPSGVDFKYALTHARHLLQTSLAARFGSLEVGVRGIYKDPIDGSSYRVVHARAALVHMIGRQRLDVSAELRNVFDAPYADVFDAPMPGRWWIFGITLRR